MLRFSTGIAVLSMALLFSGCHGDGMKDDRNATYKITVKNLTTGQPFAPAGVVLHNDGYTPFSVGSKASSGLEKLAEGGDATTFINEAMTAGAITTAKGSGLILPGAMETITVSVKEGTKSLSLAAMLVKTNDGFIGLNSFDLTQVVVNKPVQTFIKTYDSGTEKNSETNATVPALGGEGYNSTRNDSDFVFVHAGVVGVESGLVTSDLNNSAKFDNPTALIIIEKEQ